MSSENYDIGPAEVNTQKIALIGVGGALATFFSMVLMQFFFYFVRDRIDAGKGLADPLQQAADRTSAQKMKLEEAGHWVDRKEGTAAVPIGVAIDLALAGKRAKGVLPPPVPVPAPNAVPPATAPMPKAEANADAKK